MSPRFKYKAASANGSFQKGFLEAGDAQSAKRSLDQKGLIPISVRPGPSREHFFKKFFKPSVDAALLSSFTRKLGSLYRAGIPIIKALDIIQSEQHNAGFKQALVRMGESIEGGMSISEAMEQFPEYFSALFTNAIKAAEASGQLEDILHRLSDYLEMEIRTTQMVKTAIRYPTYVVISIVLATVVVVTMVVPKFAAFYGSFKAELPLATRIVINVSDFVSSYWYILIFGVALAVVLLYRFRQSTSGRRLLDRVRLEAPILGEIFLQLAMSRFCFILGTLLSSGLPLVQSLTLAGPAIGNSLISKALSSAADNLLGGGGLVSPLKKCKYFKPMVIQMLSIGMESGQLDYHLFQVARYCDEAVEYQAKKLTTRLEPVLTVLVSGLVLILALAVFLPMWNLMSVVKNR